MNSLSSMGVAWYTPENWRKLQAVTDEDDLCTYKDYLHRVTEQIEGYEAQGFAVTKMLIDVPHMIAWCQRHGLRINKNKSRAAYGAMLLAADGDRTELDPKGFEDPNGELDSVRINQS